MLTARSPIIGPFTATPAQCTRWLLRHEHGEYTNSDISGVIVPGYADVCRVAGVNLVVVIAQLDIETDGLNSALSQRRDKDGRDLRNPGGIGVWQSRDKATPEYRTGTVFDADVQGYRPACGFPSWIVASQAHVGRLVAWATSASERTPQQRTLVAQAMAARPLGSKLHGSARQLIYLGKVHNPQGSGWASPGSDYGDHIARVANAIAAQR